MIFDTKIDYADDEGVEWVAVSQMSLCRGVVRHWIGYVDGERRYSRVIWEDDEPTDPSPLELAA
jgi:hypothetical protein